MRVVVAKRALRQIEDIHQFLSERRPQAADDFLGAFSDIKFRLGEHPLSSPLIRRPDLRQATMTRFPYVVTYRASTSRVMILGVFHAARHPAVRTRP